MDDIGIGLSGLGLLFVLIALRVPIGVALIGVSIGGLYVLLGWRVAWGALAVMLQNSFAYLATAGEVSRI